MPFNLETKKDIKRIYYFVPFVNISFLFVDSFPFFSLGTVGSEETWRYCVMDTDRVLGFALGAMFVEEAFQGDSKKKVSYSLLVF